MATQQHVVQPLLVQFQQLFFICKIVGVYPQDLEQMRHKNVLEKSKSGIWYVIFKMLLYCTLYNLLIYSFGDEERSLRASQSTLTLVIGLFLTYIGLAMMVTDQVTALRNQSKLGALYERLVLVDERLYKERCVIDNTRLAKRIRFMLILTVIFELTISFSSFFLLVDYMQWTSILWFAVEIPTFINSLDKIWFAVSLYALKERFEAINATLEEMVNKHERYIAWLNGTDAEEAEMTDLDTQPLYTQNLEYLYKELGGFEQATLKNSGKNKIAPIAHSLNSFGDAIYPTPLKPQKFSTKPATKNIEPESELNNVGKVEDKLNNLCQVHDEICEIGKTLNELWSYPILIIMAYGFLIFTAQLYFLYCATQDQPIPSLFRSAKSPVITVIALSFTSGRCIYLIYLSWKTSLSSKRTGISLHKCGVVADDNLLYEIVNHLSLKLLNHSVDFSACGFFTLDMETLYGVSGGITSYLIILIQFNLAAQQAKDAIQSLSSFNGTSGLATRATEISNITFTTFNGFISTTMTSLTDN